ERGRAFFRHHSIDHRRWTRRIPSAASGFEARDRFHGSVVEAGSRKSFVKWRPFSRRNPIHTLKPPAKAIMQTFHLFLAISEPSSCTLMVTGSVSLALPATLLPHQPG